MARATCGSCGRVATVERDVLAGAVVHCITCGPQYGRRAPTAAEMAETNRRYRRGREPERPMCNGVPL